MAETYILYDGKYSGEEIDAFLSRVELTKGAGALQAEIAGTIARALPYGQYMTVTQQKETDGRLTLIFGVPKGYDGIDGRDGVDGISAYEAAVLGGFEGTQEEFYALLGNVDRIVIEVESSKDAAQAAKELAEAARDEAAASKLNAEASAGSAAESDISAAGSADEAESWAIGGTGTRDGEDTNNSKYWAGIARAEAERASVTPVDGVYNVILTDRVTSERYALLIENGHIKLLGVSDELEATDMQLVDNQTGAAYSLVVDNGRLGIEEVA